MSTSMEIKTPSSSPHVAILMGAYEGEAYLSPQLDSIERQHYTHWTLHVSDDSQTPATYQLLRMYQKRWGESRLKIYTGKQQGFATNFMSLIRNESIQADYYAFADQDDSWYPDKLARAVDTLAALPQQQPLLYTARSRLVDSRGTPIGYSPLQKRSPSFQNALVQNIASGNTMAFNPKARDWLVRASHGEDTGLHDWWCYLLISGCGGHVFYDSTPCLDYRQHADNLIGMRTGWGAALQRMRRIWQGGHHEQIERNLNALSPFKSWLTPQNARRLETYSRSRKGNALQRVIGLRQTGVHRQTALGSLAMYVAAFLNKG